jgi:hypothetical protein
MPLLYKTILVIQGIVYFNMKEVQKYYGFFYGNLKNNYPSCLCTIDIDVKIDWLEIWK